MSKAKLVLGFVRLSGRFGGIEMYESFGVDCGRLVRIVAIHTHRAQRIDQSCGCVVDFNVAPEQIVVATRGRAGLAPFLSCSGATGFGAFGHWCFGWPEINQIAAISSPTT